MQGTYTGIVKYWSKQSLRHKQKVAKNRHCKISRLTLRRSAVIFSGQLWGRSTTHGVSAAKHSSSCLIPFLYNACPFVIMCKKKIHECFIAISNLYCEISYDSFSETLNRQTHHINLPGISVSTLHLYQYLMNCLTIKINSVFIYYSNTLLPRIARSLHQGAEQLVVMMWPTWGLGLRQSRAQVSFA